MIFERSFKPDRRRRKRQLLNTSVQVFTESAELDALGINLRQKLRREEQWELVEPMLPPPRRRRDNRGRPWASNRACFEGILWILQTGAAWRFLPDEFPSPSTCWRRLKQWEDEGVWLNAMRKLLGALDE